MTVYVDDVEHPFGRMLMCHLWADTLNELLAMVDAIGVQRKWIQGHPTLSRPKDRSASWCHFDIAKSKRALAIKAGAVLTDRYGPLEHCARLQMTGINQWTLLKQRDPDAQDIRDCERRLDRIARTRAAITDPPRPDPELPL